VWVFCGLVHVLVVWRAVLVVAWVSLATYLCFGLFVVALVCFSVSLFRFGLPVVVVIVVLVGVYLFAYCGVVWLCVLGYVARVGVLWLVGMFRCVVIYCVL